MSRRRSLFAHRLPDLNRRLEIYLSSLPPGVDPTTYGVERARALLARMVLFPMISTPDEHQPNLPILENEELVGVEINEALHQFSMAVRPAGGGGETENVVGETQVAAGHVRWHLAPDNYTARPGAIPPPTPLRPTISQSFVMEGVFLFGDAQRSGFRGFAVGRTFPHSVDGRLVLRFAAMVDILEGYGAVFGLLGSVGINGVVEPPELMRLAVMPVLLDFAGHFATERPLPPVPCLPDPSPGEVFFILRGETEPAKPMPIVPMPRGLLLAQADLPLRSVEVDFEASSRLVSHKSVGPQIGAFHSNFWIGPIPQGAVLPFQSVNGRYSFVDRRGRSLGHFDADVVEGRARRFELPGLEAPSFRFAGIGPIDSGTGIFEGVCGFLTLVGAMSVFPRAMSIYYIVRLDDPTGRIREATYEAWSDDAPEKERTTT